MDLLKKSLKYNVLQKQDNINFKKTLINIGSSSLTTQRFKKTFINIIEATVQ